MQKVSVIIPAYNAAGTIKRCLDSIIKQSYSNLEIIIVDDGSKDDTLRILNQYKDNRIAIITQENKGAAAARNRGIDVSTGAYITFVDADDYIDTMLYEKLISAAIEYQADIVSTAIREIYNGNKIEIRNNPENINIIDGIDAARLMFTYSGGVRTVIWDKIYRKSLVDDIRFNEEYKYCEDALFNLRVFLKCGRYIRIPYVGYTYDHRMSQVTGQKNYSSSRLSNIYAVEDMYEYLLNDGNRSLFTEFSQFKIALYRQVFYGLLLNGDYKRDHKDDYKIICKSAKKISPNIVSKVLDWREYIQWNMYLYGPRLFLLIHKIHHMSKR